MGIRVLLVGYFIAGDWPRFDTEFGKCFLGKPWQFSIHHIYTSWYWGSADSKPSTLMAVYHVVQINDAKPADVNVALW